MTAVRRPEQALHRAISEYLARCLGGCAWFTHVPNGGWRSKTEAAILKSMGVKPGVPDLLVVDGGRALWLEIKAGNGRVTPAQQECHQALRTARSCVAVVRSIEEVEIVLKQWCVPLRGHVHVAAE